MLKVKPVCGIVITSLICFTILISSSINGYCEEKELYAPGEVIVKLREKDAPELLFRRKYLERKTKLADILLRLKTRYNLKDEIPVFETLHQELGVENLSLQRMEEEFRAKFPRRRFPKKREPVDLLPIYLLKTDQDVLKLCAELNKDPEVEYAQPKYVYKIIARPNDPRYDELWGIKKIQCEAAWDITEGLGAVVCINDTGIDYNHEDLRANIWSDANGKHGYDFVNNDSDPMDDHNHGTHCAGTVAAVGNNGIGVIGVGPKIKLMATKGLNSGGSGTSEMLANGIRWATDHGADVISNSWGPGGRSPSDPVCKEAIDYAYERGVVCVFAAGNSNDDVQYYFPANYERTIAVAATDSNDEKASFSNYGDLIDVSAPGVGVLSTVRNNGYDSYSGTSMACPHAAGVCGLLKSISPGAPYEEIRRVIREFSDDIGAPGKDYIGYGRVNAYLAVKGMVGSIKLEITSPADGSYIKGNVDIYGSAYSEGDFKKYEIYYAPTSNPDNLTLITSSTIPVEEGLLGTWNTTQSPEGEKRLILKLFTIDGRTFQRFTKVNVDNRNDPPTFISVPDKMTAVVDRLTEFEIKASDPDNPETPWGQLTYSAYNLPPGAQYNTYTQIFSWKPTLDDRGSYKATFEARDSQFTVTHDITFVTLYIEKVRITTDSGNQDDPAIYKDKIVFEDSGISMYDLSTGQKTRISSSGRDPAIYGDKIVWGGRGLYMYDLSTGQGRELFSSASGEITDVSIWKDKIAYHGGSGYTIYGIGIYDLSTNQMKQINTNVYANNPAIHEGKIVWDQWPSGIYLYDHATGQSKVIIPRRFPDDPIDPAIYEDKVVFIWDLFGWVASSGIYMYNLSTGKETRVCDVPSPDDPIIYDDKIVCKGSSGIYMYDPGIITTSGQVVQVVDSGSAQNHAFYENQIAYADKQNDYDVYLARLIYGDGPSPPSNRPPVANAGPDQTVIDGDNDGKEQVTLDGSGSTDPDGTIVSYVWREGGLQIATGVKPTVTLSTGTHSITLTVTDDGGLTATDTVIVTITVSPSNVYTITATATPGGTITPSGEVKVEEGADQTFTITPDSGYRIANVLVDGTFVGAVTSYTFTNVTSDHTIRASFSRSGYTKFPFNWEHLPGPLKTKDEGNVPPELEPYDPDPENFHPTGNQSDPCVLWDQGKFRMWFSAYVVNDGVGMQGQAYAESLQDGILWEDPKDRELWVKLVVPPDPGSAYETPNVCIYPITGEYYMYSSVRGGSGPSGWYIKMAKSRDGINWTKHPTPVLTASYRWEEAGVLEPSVIYDEDERIFKMWYASWGSYYGRWQGYVGYATSPDGINWQKHPEPIFLPEAGSWDSELVGHENIIKDPNGGYHLVYVGTYSLGQAGLYGIGHAYSEDGIHWERNPDNPIVKREPNTWKSGMVGGPTPVFYNGKLYLYYFGSKNNQVWTQVYFGLSIGEFEGDGNNPPVLNPIGNKSINEGQTLSFTVSGSDPDGDALVYSASNLPTGASFNAGTRTFSWTPTYNQAGIYNNVHFEVSDGIATDSEDITITVNNVNRPPVLTAIGNKSINEGESLSFTVSGSDPDGDNLIYSASNLPQGASFNAGTRTFSWTPTYQQAGTYPNVHFAVRDGSLSDSEDITITVNNVSGPPVLDPIGNKSVNENTLLTFIVNATDPDGDALTYSASNLPQGASFDTATRTFSWTPTYQQAGIYNNVHFEVSDGTGTDSEDITITVNNVNRAPILNAIGNKSVNEGENLSFTVSGSDPDGDSLTYSASNLPQGASFDSTIKTFSWTPTYQQAGIYNNVHFEVSDGTATDSEDITITVNNLNRPPILEAIGNKSVNEGQNLSFTVSGSDPDGDNLTYSASNLPQGAGFDSVTRTFNWTPTYNQAGIYPNVHFEVSDGTGTDSEDITITVNNVNRAPVLNAIGNKSVNEAQTLSFSLSGSDPDGDSLTYSASNLPQGANFDSGTRTFSWIPTYEQAGTYPDVHFEVTDGPLSDSENITITVNNVNRAPLLDSIGNKSTTENQTLTFTVNATDPDGDPLTYSVQSLPNRATFQNQTFTWTPTTSDVGNHQLTFIASDGSLSDSETIVITVKEGEIRLKIRFNTDRVSKIGILYISGETSEGAIIEEVKVLDEYNKILDIDMKDNVSITGERYITGIVIVGDIIKKYPLLSGIKIRIMVAKGEKTKEGQTGVARIEPYAAGPDRIGVYNNVFNPLEGEKTIIKIDTAEQMHIKINLYDTRGKKIREIADEERGAGIYRYYWDGKDDSGNVVGSGLYLVHIETGDYKKTKKIVLVK